MQSFSIDCDEEIPDRSHVFHMRFEGAGDAWRAQDVLALFSVYGAVIISWIDAQSCWVSLVTRKNAQLGTASV